MALVELRINDLVVISDARLELGGGFTVITGETGAGKSVCVTALRLALGAKADAAVVRAGADSARITAVFDDVPQPVWERLRDVGIEWDELLTVTRELSRVERSRCRINGALVSQTLLREIGDQLAEVTTQGVSQRLTSRSWQRQLLDASGGPPLAALGARMQQCFERRRGLLEVREALRQRVASTDEDVERATVVVASLRHLDLRGDESAALVAERERLQCGVEIISTARAIQTAALGDDDVRGAADLIVEAVATGRPLAGIAGDLDAVMAEALELAERLRDLGAEARRRADDVVLDSARLIEVDERLTTIHEVCRRFGSIEAALAALAEAEIVLSGRDDGTELRQIDSQVEAAVAATVAAATELRKGREAAARRLERQVTSYLNRVDMAGARFRVVIGSRVDPAGILYEGETVRCTAHGVDDVDFRLATAERGVPLPLDGGPSGGELARLALVLRAVVGAADVGTVILDEVDVGIGGETAARVGDLIAAMAVGRQVIAVTHRAEIAARARGHLVVQRGDDGGDGSAVVSMGDGAHARTVEVARLMSGRATPAALARARELLDEGAATAACQPRIRSM